MAVHVSGDNRSLRVRDPKGPLATGFLGFRWFPIDAKWRVTGRFIKDAAPRPLKVLNTFGDIDSYNTEGVIEFTLAGKTLHVRPFTTRHNVDKQSGKLTFVERYDVSKAPRGFTIDPTGSFLLSAGQDGNTINIFKIDKASGKLTLTDNKIDIPQITCLKWVAVK